MSEGDLGLVLLVGYAIAAAVVAHYRDATTHYSRVSAAAATAATVLFLATIVALEGIDKFILIAALGAWFWSFVVALVVAAAFRAARRARTVAAGRDNSLSTPLNRRSGDA